MLGWKRDTNNSSTRFTIGEKHVRTSIIYFLPRPIYRSSWKIYVIGTSSSSWIEDRNRRFSFQKNCGVEKLRRFPLRIPLLHLDKHQRRYMTNSLLFPQERCEFGLHLTDRCLKQDFKISIELMNPLLSVSYHHLYLSKDINMYFEKVIAIHNLYRTLRRLDY